MTLLEICKTHEQTLNELLLLKNTKKHLAIDSGNSSAIIYFQAQIDILEQLISEFYKFNFCKESK